LPHKRLGGFKTNLGVQSGRPGGSHQRAPRVELVGQTGTVTAGTKLGAAVEVNNSSGTSVDELAAVSTLASRADLERRRKREDREYPTTRTSAGIHPPQGAKGQRPTGAYQEYKSAEREKQLALTTVGASSASDNDDDNSDF